MNKYCFSGRTAMCMMWCVLLLLASYSSKESGLKPEVLHSAATKTKNGGENGGMTNVVRVLNKETKRTLILNTDEEWKVDSQPDWIGLDRKEGNGKSEVIMTIRALAKGSAMREGEVVFQLNTEGRSMCYRVEQYDYPYDEDEIITLKIATEGKGVNVVFLGDGFDGKEVGNGEYLRAMEEAMVHFFDREPYRTYRSGFNVYTGIAVSPESGIGTKHIVRHNKFGTTFARGADLSGEYNDIFNYACKIPTGNRVEETLIVVVPNVKGYDGICYLWDDGSVIAYCPTNDYGYPSSLEEGGPYDFKVARCDGWCQNMSPTGKMNHVPWFLGVIAHVNVPVTLSRSCIRQSHPVYVDKKTNFGKQQRLKTVAMNPFRCIIAVEAILLLVIILGHWCVKKNQKKNKAFRL